MLSLKTLFGRWTFALIVSALLWSQIKSLAAPPSIGNTFPSLTSFGLAGALPDLHGKVTLIDFWASWCAPCKRSFPVMKALQDKYGPRGFTVVAISVDEKKSAMDEFLKKNPVPFNMLHDAKGQLAQALALEKMPTSFLIDGEGKILAIHTGFEGDVTRKAYVAEIERALDAKRP